jgi:hypothetical protein
VFKVLSAGIEHAARKAHGVVDEFQRKPEVGHLFDRLQRTITVAVSFVAKVPGPMSSVVLGRCDTHYTA